LNNLSLTKLEDNIITSNIMSHNITEQQKIAKKLDIYFLFKNNYWYFYNKKAYNQAQADYKLLSLYTIEDTYPELETLGNLNKYDNFDCCFYDALNYYNKMADFSYLYNQTQTKKLFRYLIKKITNTTSTTKKIKI
jgi:hypothetical protein